MSVGDAFKLWSEMLTSFGSNYVAHQRFLRHYYNAVWENCPRSSTLR